MRPAAGSSPAAFRLRLAYLLVFSLTAIIIRFITRATGKGTGLPAIVIVVVIVVTVAAAAVAVAVVVVVPATAAAGGAAAASTASTPRGSSANIEKFMANPRVLHGMEACCQWKAIKISLSGPTLHSGRGTTKRRRERERERERERRRERVRERGWREREGAGLVYRTEEKLLPKTRNEDWMLKFRGHWNIVVLITILTATRNHKQYTARAIGALS